MWCSRCYTYPKYLFLVFISLNFLPFLIFLASVVSPPPVPPFFYSSYWPATHISSHITSHISFHILSHISLIFDMMEWWYQLPRGCVPSTCLSSTPHIGPLLIFPLKLHLIFPLIFLFIFFLIFQLIFDVAPLSFPSPFWSVLHQYFYMNHTHLFCCLILCLLFHHPPSPSFVNSNCLFSLTSHPSFKFVSTNPAII